MKGKHLSKGVIILVALCTLGMGVFLVLPNIKSSKDESNPGSAIPSPGEPGNSGDANKTNYSSPTPSLALMTSSKPEAVISQFEVNQPAMGTIHPITVLTGLSEGTCTLTLKSPTNANQTKTGEIIYDGHYYSCNLGSLQVKEQGVWGAKLQVSSSSASPVEAETTVKVGL